MTMISAAEAASNPLTDDESVLKRVHDLVGHAERRGLWLMFVGADGVQLPILLPVDDYPPQPGDDAPRFARIVSEVMGTCEAENVIVVWERVGPAEATDDDRAWASALAIAFAHADIALRGQLICHSSGVRWFAPDDFL